MVLKARMILLLMIMSLMGYSQMVVYQMPFDSDAQAFITAAAITDATQQNSINTLVVDLKANNLWTKMKAIYPFVGGTASSHKYNLKDPRDLDAAYRLTFNGGWTHSSSGALSNGSTGYANTNFIPSTGFNSITDASIGIYVSGNRQDAFAFGGRGGSNAGASYIAPSFLSETNGVYRLSGDGQVVIAQTNANGFFACSYISNTPLNIFNGTSVTTGVPSAQPTSLSPVPYFIGCFNNNGSGSGFSIYTHKLDYIGDGLSTTQLTTLYNLFTTFNITLGR